MASKMVNEILFKIYESREEVLLPKHKNILSDNALHNQIKKYMEPNLESMKDLKQF
jgi:hypothetical protein